MTGLVLKDMLVMRKTLKTYVLFLAFYLLLAVIGLFPISTITAVTQIIIMMLPLSAFSFDELAKWDRYALTFPTGRRSLVGARYLFTLVMAAAATLYSLVACVVLSIGKGQSAMAENLLSLMVSLGLGLIIADILLPLCYKLGVERARPYMYTVSYTHLVNELYRVSDYITIHVPYNNNTKDFINAEAISKMKGQVRVLNLARGGLVNDEDMIAALESGRVAKYVTDFPDERITTVKNVIALPHLGASTPESEENCAVMAARQLQDYLVNGNITNSVNLPNVSQEWSGIARLCLIHKNVPAMLTQIMSTLSDDRINVENMTNKSRKDYAYTLSLIHIFSGMESISSSARLNAISMRSSQLSPIPKIPPEHT